MTTRADPSKWRQQTDDRDLAMTDIARHADTLQVRLATGWLESLMRLERSQPGVGGGEVPWVVRSPGFTQVIGAR